MVAAHIVTCWCPLVLHRSSCVQAIIRIDDGSPDPSAASHGLQPPPSPPASTPAAPPKTPPKGARPSADPGPINKLLTEGLVFERLLLGKRETKTLIIHNPGEWCARAQPSTCPVTQTIP